MDAIISTKIVSKTDFPRLLGLAIWVTLHHSYDAAWADRLSDAVSRLQGSLDLGPDRRDTAAWVGCLVDAAQQLWGCLDWLCVAA